MKVSVNLDLCMGAGSCKQLAPEVFDQNEDGTVILRQTSPTVRLYDDVRKAADCCPSQAIVIEES